MEAALCAFWDSVQNIVPPEAERISERTWLSSPRSRLEQMPERIITVVNALALRVDYETRPGIQPGEQRGFSELYSGSHHRAMKWL